MGDRFSYRARRDALLRRVPYITWPTPTWSGISPSTLLAAGGETVTITGTGFRVPDGYGGWLNNVTGVRLNTYTGTSLTVVSETSLTFVTPAMAAGDLNMWLKSNGGDSNHRIESTALTFRILLETGGGDDLLMETGDALRQE